MSPSKCREKKNVTTNDIAIQSTVSLNSILDSKEKKILMFFQ